MRTKQFHLGDVLSIITRHILSPGRPEDLEDILIFLTGDKNVLLVGDLVEDFTRLQRVIVECKASLFQQFPQLREAVADLEKRKENIKNTVKLESSQNVIIHFVVRDWFKEQIAKYGEKILVSPISEGAR